MKIDSLVDIKFKHDWTYEEIQNIYDSPLLNLIFEAGIIHRKNFDPQEIQVSNLISVKTGGCPEDCSYCPQAAKYQTDIEKHPLMDLRTVRELAIKAKDMGASRICLGAAWREVKPGKDFDKIIEMVKEISSMDLEVCCTLGMLREEEAIKLKEAGLYAYNHNIDTSENMYKEIITTRKYQDRLNTLNNVRKAKLTVCSGGIIGLGEKKEDRINMLKTLASLSPHPESVPINTLVSVEGTPLENKSPIPIWELIRTIATARILMPASFIRLSAGRLQRTQVEQALCFMAGANSIFSGEKLLTTPNPDLDSDTELLKLLGLNQMRSKLNQNEELNFA
jgi:biotin synthase